MVIKVLISGITASKEVRKRQQRALFILDSLQVDYKAIDVTDGNDAENRLLRETCKKREGQKMAFPPQFFRVDEDGDDEYLGDWEDFDAACDEDAALPFLKLEDANKSQATTDVVNGQGQQPPEGTVKGENEGDGLEINGHSNLDAGLLSDADAGHSDIDAGHSDVDDPSSHDVHIASDHEPELEQLGDVESDAEEEEIVASDAISPDTKPPDAGEEEEDDEDVEE